MKKTLRPLVWYHLALEIFTLITLVFLIIFMDFKALFGYLFAAAIVAAMLVFGSLIDLRRNRHVKLEVKDGKLVVPSFEGNVFWPIDFSGDLIKMPGFEFYGDDTKPPFFDGIHHFEIPIKNIKLIWLGRYTNSYEYLYIGTDFFDVQIALAPLGKKRTEKFLLAHDIPADLFSPDLRVQSVVYQANKKHLAHMLEENPVMENTFRHKRLWMIYSFFLLIWGFVMGAGILYKDYAASMGFLPFIGLSIYLIVNSLGERKLTVDEKQIQFQVKKKKYSIAWENIKYFYSHSGSTMFCTGAQHLSIPDELVVPNLLLQFLLFSRYYEGKMQIKRSLSSKFLGNKGTRVR